MPACIQESLCRKVLDHAKELAKANATVVSAALSRLTNGAFRWLEIVGVDGRVESYRGRPTRWCRARSSVASTMRSNSGSGNCSS